MIWLWMNEKHMDSVTHGFKELQKCLRHTESLPNSNVWKKKSQDRGKQADFTLIEMLTHLHVNSVCQEFDHHHYASAFIISKKGLIYSLRIF